uniref:Uncharacterized protein n=1 Tax=Nelumbo nucifera TaxID=4432 RepID=A0A822ZTK5_NELNU|nr:TPA_asm: hypothetical protein HUJ06_004446 [Nelumbo nucifera]
MQTYTKRRLSIAVERIRNSTMENQSESKVYVHYNHTDPCKQARWTARGTHHCVVCLELRWVSVDSYFLFILLAGHTS